MNSKKAEVTRIKNMLENSRLCSTANFKELFIVDLENVINQYFELVFSPEVEIIREKSVLKVNIEFSASCVKNYGILPLEQT